MMRSSPLGFIKDINFLLALTEMQASITHNTFSSIISAKIISLLYHYTIYNLGDLPRPK
jgi:ADP-ribosylglycohydrolase